MKKLNMIASLSALVILFFCTNNAMAQTPVTKGSSHTYTATPLPESGSNYSYTWTVDGGTSTTTFGTGAQTNAILWDGAAGVHTITVFPTDNTTGCKGNNYTFQVNILDNLGIKWNAASTTLCPNTDNQTGDHFDLIANFTGIDGTWSFKYTIDGGSEQSVTVSSGKTSTISIASVSNPSNTDKITHVYKITEVTSPDGVTSKYDASDTNPDHTFTETINATPGIKSITQN